MTVTDLILERYYSQNLSTLDRVARAASLPLAAVAVWAGGVTGAVAVAVLATAALTFKTALTGKCIIYYTLGLSTKRA